jgi:hypothetical protein
MALYVVFMEAFAFELTVGVGRLGCNDISCFCADPAVRRNSAFPYQRKLRVVRRYKTFRCGWQKT